MDFSGQVQLDIYRATQEKIAAMSDSLYMHKTAGAGGALLGLGMGGLAGAGLGAGLGYLQGANDPMYDNGIDGLGSMNIKPVPQYEGQEPLPWYQNPRSKALSTIGGAIGLGTLGSMGGMILGDLLTSVR